MPLIKKHIIDNLLETAEIVPVAMQLGLDLKKAGSSFKCCSPWRDEKTPSCMFSEAKNIFKDFSTGKGGSPVNLIMEYKGVSWIDAIHFLADMYHVELEYEQADYEKEQKVSTKQDLLVICEAACKKFQTAFFELPANHPAKVYTLSRFTEDEIIEWKIGYAPNEWGFLRDKAAENGALQMLQEAGLVKLDEKKSYDFFRDRIMFPITDHRGRIVSFGGRDYPGSAADQDKEKKVAKYLNGPETLIYSKSRTLYGLSAALRTIAKEKRVFLVEGYSDVIAQHSNGYTNTVASCGTAFNELLARFLKRFCDNVVLMLDGDEAGIKAAEKNINLLLSEGFMLQVIELPNGADPYSFWNNSNSK